MESKKCKTCGYWKPTSEFYANKRYKDGLESICKTCWKERSHNYFVNNRPKIYESREKWRLENPNKIRQYNQHYKAKYPEKRRETIRKYKQTHVEQVRAYAHSPKARETKRRCASAKPEKYKRTVRNWRSANPDNISAIHQRRRARKRANGGSFTAQKWKALKAKYNYTCLACGRSEPEIKLTPDHVIPLACGGSSDIINIQPLCMDCNIRKRAKMIDYR